MLNTKNATAILPWVSAFSAVILLTISMILEEGQIHALLNASLVVHLSLLYTAFCAILLGHAMWYYLLSQYNVSSVAPFSLLEPIFGVAGAVMLLGETISTQMLIGSFIAICGVGLIVIRRPQHARVR